MNRAGLALTNRRVSWLGRKPAWCAVVGAASLAVAAGTALPGAAGAATSASKPNVASVTLSASPLGLDIAPWVNPTTLTAIEPLIKAAGINQLHYGGGGTADQYDWATQQIINDCADQSPAAFAETCGQKTYPLDFDTFSTIAQAIGAQSYATVNYGTGTPAMAADWVAHAVANNEPVAEWSIGNESYGCWESNWWVTQPPLDDTDYVPNGAGCPWVTDATQADGVADMAESYAENALPYMVQMTAADPSIKIGIPWAFDGSVGGAGVPDNNTAWNTPILDADGQYISFVEAHWYPFGATVPNTQAELQSVETIPAEYAKMRAELNAHDPKATITIGETGVSYLATNVPCIAAGAPFAAADALEWLSSGAATVDWWPVDTGENPGSACTLPEEAMFTGNGTPDSVYYGYLLASQLAQPNAQLSALTTSNGQVLGFQSVLPDGRTAVELINTNTSSSEKVTASTSLTGSLSTQSLFPTNLKAVDSDIVTGTTTAAAFAGGVTLPAESILVLKGQLPTKLTLGAAANTLKPGAKVTLSGTLTRNGATAPVGTAVKVYRRVSGSSVNSATLTATTGAGGTFTVTNTPPGRGNYSYVAAYGGTSLYASASSSYLVHVVALKPALKLTVSAGTVKPGRKVTVTATLGATHANRTLTIYAQIKGGGRKMLKRATVNAKGQLSIVYTMRVNTTFSVAFPGDNWYSPATVTTVVKA
jgi:hypothetical protein